MNPINRRKFLAVAALSPLTTKLLWEELTPTSLAAQTTVGQGVTPIDSRFAAYLRNRDEALREPLRGVTTNGEVEQGLFERESPSLMQTTKPIAEAAAAFLKSLDSAQLSRLRFALDTIEWRDWSNVHRYPRKGVSLGEMSGPQRDCAFDLLRVTLSESGFRKARAVIELNEALAHMAPKPQGYGRNFYFFTVVGTPSLTEPWGWQIDGHHLAINCFIWGQDMVLTPLFMGSEPTSVKAGEFSGLSVLQPEEVSGLEFARTLTRTQRQTAVIEPEPHNRDVFATSFNDNLVLPYAGIAAEQLSNAQRDALVRLIDEYVSNLPSGHAEARLAQVRRHLSRTHFAWMGGMNDSSVFYYRIHSPVLLIEFGHQSGVALGSPSVITRNHIHTVVRTPNGGDYGNALLRHRKNI